MGSSDLQRSSFCFNYEWENVLASRFHAPVNDVAGPDAREEPVGVVDCHEGDPVVEDLHDVLADLGVLEAVVAALGLGGGLA